MDFTLKIFFLLFALVFIANNLIVLLFTILSPFSYLVTNFKFRLPKGYTITRLTISTVMILISFYMYTEFIKILKVERINNSLTYIILECIPWLSVILVLTVFVRISQSHTLRQWFKILLDKNTSVLDFLEPIITNSETISGTNLNIPDSILNNCVTENSIGQAKNVHPLLKNLTRRELELIISTYNSILIIDEISKNRIF